MAPRSDTLSKPRKTAGCRKRTALKPVYHDPEKIGCPRTALAALAKHLPTFRDPDLVIGTATPAREAGEGVIVMGYFSPGPEATALMGDAYAYGWVREFYWMRWSQTPEGRRLLRDPSVLARAGEEELARVVTVCMREAHWGEDALEDRFREGLLTRILERAATLHAKSVISEWVAQYVVEPDIRASLRQLLAIEDRSLLSYVSPWQASIDTVKDPHLREYMQETLDMRYEGYEDHLMTLKEEVRRWEIQDHRLA